eukprot:496502-Pyramimonas_sp.AAC.1
MLECETRLLTSCVFKLAPQDQALPKDIPLTIVSSDQGDTWKHSIRSHLSPALVLLPHCHCA